VLVFKERNNITDNVGRLTCVGVYIEVMHALLDLYIIGSEVKNLKRVRKILNMKVVE
jgi:hypothetical protein